MLDSGNSYNIVVRPPGLKNERVPFSEHSKTGKSLNLYHAFMLAQELSKKQ